MNEYVKTVISKKVERMMDALARHGFNLTFIEFREEAFSLVMSLVQKRNVIGVDSSIH